MDIIKVPLQRHLEVDPKYLNFMLIFFQSKLVCVCERVRSKVPNAYFRKSVVTKLVWCDVCGVQSSAIVESGINNTSSLSLSLTCCEMIWEERTHICSSLPTPPPSFLCKILYISKRCR